MAGLCWYVYTISKTLKSLKRVSPFPVFLTFETWDEKGYKTTSILRATPDWRDYRARWEYIKRWRVRHFPAASFSPANYFISERYNLFPCNIASSKHAGSRENTLLRYSCSAQLPACLDEAILHGNKLYNVNRHRVWTPDGFILPLILFPANSSPALSSQFPQYQYYTGDATDASVQAAIKTKFISFMNAIAHGHIACNPKPSCTPDDLQIFVG